MPTVTVALEKRLQAPVDRAYKRCPRRQNGLSYSRFIRGLKLAEIDVNRKMLADMAISDPASFTELVRKAKDHLEKEPEVKEAKV